MGVPRCDSSERLQTDIYYSRAENRFIPWSVCVLTSWVLVMCVCVHGCLCVCLCLLLCVSDKCFSVFLAIRKYMKFYFSIFKCRTLFLPCAAGDATNMVVMSLLEEL